MKAWHVQLTYKWTTQGGYVEKDAAALLDMIKEMEPSDSDAYHITCVEISEEEYAKLPEFQGF